MCSNASTRSQVIASMDVNVRKRQCKLSMRRGFNVNRSNDTNYKKRQLACKK